MNFIRWAMLHFIVADILLIVIASFWSAENMVPLAVFSSFALFVMGIFDDAWFKTDGKKYLRKG